MLQKYGTHGANIGIIAKEAKVDRATIYYHFPDKFQLYREVVQDDLKDMSEVLEREASKSGSPSERLRACCRAVMGAQVRAGAEFAMPTLG